MGAHYDHLSLSDRREIYRLHEAKIPIRLIAERLGRHRSSIHRELRRNWFRDGRYLRGYFPITAQELTTRRRRRIGKLHRDPALAAHVVDRLNAAWSPEQIAGRLRHDAEPTRQVCHETIYRFIYGPDGLARELHKLLPSRRKRRRPRAARRARGYKIPDSNTFAQRPAEIGARTSFGHWECDLVAFRLDYGKSNIRSLVERTSRYSFFSRNPSRHSAGVMSGLLRDLSSLPILARQTVTFDRGTEFAGYATLKQNSGIESYFCAPHAPWQKGTVENTNGRLRRFLPLDTDIAQIAEDDLSAITVRMNTTPRKCLGFRTPEEVFLESLVRAGDNEKP